MLSAEQVAGAPLHGLTREKRLHKVFWRVLLQGASEGKAAVGADAEPEVCGFVLRHM